MRAIIDTATGVIEQIVASADGSDLTGRTVADLPDDFASQPYEWNGTAIVPNATALRELKWAATKARCSEQQAAGYTTPYGLVQTDVASREFVAGAATAAFIRKAAGVAYSISFTMNDNTVLTLDADQMIALGLGVHDYVVACHDVCQAFRVTLDAATTPEALAAIDIEAGWPTTP